MVQYFRVSEMEKRIFIVSVCFLTILTTCNSVKPKEFGSLPHQNVEISFIELGSSRDKREAIEPSSSSSPSSVSSSSSSNVQSSQDTLTAAINLSKQQLLGVNGSGQLLDLSSTTEPILAATISTKKLLGDAFADSGLEMPDDDFGVGTIDVNEEDINATVAKNNITQFQTDYHVYYNSTVFTNKERADRQWNDIQNNLTISNLLSKSHRRAMTIQLSFDFPFYGHPVRNVTVATGGFLYTGDHVHSWLAATQYIAPLMANFDTSLSNDSFVKYSDNGTAFTVLWENVRLQEKDGGSFTFSATLYKSGNITFAYYNIPVSIKSIEDDKHPVKVGLSDAYIIDKTIFFARRKTIYEYHRVSFGYQKVENNTVIDLVALPSCLASTDCQSCTSVRLSVTCRWCPAINRCSTGTDRRRQEWMHKGCDNLKIEEISHCPARGEKGNNYNATMDADTNEEENKYNATDLTQDTFKISIPASEAESGVNTLLSFFIPIGLVLAIVCWVFYAYRNPHTKSGQLLIQMRQGSKYRPSQWSWRRGEARYTAATIHM